MIKKAKVWEGQDARIDRWARLGTEVSHAPNPDLFSWRCTLIGISFVAAFAVPIAISDGMPVAEELVVTEGLQLFAVGYALAYLLWVHFTYEGPLVRVVLSPAGLLHKNYSQSNIEPSIEPSSGGYRFSDIHFEWIAYRHIRSACVSRGGKRNTVLVIRVEYEYPKGLVRTIEFVPAKTYKINGRGGHSLCDEIMRRVKLEKARINGESIAPASSGLGDVEGSA